MVTTTIEQGDLLHLGKNLWFRPTKGMEQLNVINFSHRLELPLNFRYIILVAMGEQFYY